MVERPCVLLDACRKSWLALSELRILELPWQMKGEGKKVHRRGSAVWGLEVGMTSG